MAVQWLKLHASDAGGMRSILGQGMKISHATWHGQRGKREVYALPSLGKSRLEKFSFVREIQFCKTKEDTLFLRMFITAFQRA